MIFTRKKHVKFGKGIRISPNKRKLIFRDCHDKPVACQYGKVKNMLSVFARQTRSLPKAKS